jgi:dipeptidase E
VALHSAPRRDRAAPGPGRTIFALGGHDFSRRSGNEALRDYILGLAPAEEPRICLLPTASGDPREQIFAFRRSLEDLACIASHISLFRLETEPVTVQEHLLGQDIIYVGGGSMLNLLAVWRAHGIDEILREAWSAGTVLCGQSAGALCWFEHGITRSSGGARAVPGLGLLPGALCVHYHRDPGRRRALLDDVSERHLPGYGIDDGAGLLSRDDELADAVSGGSGGAWRVAEHDGVAEETALDIRVLDDPRPAIDAPLAEIIELRRVRALRP